MKAKVISRTALLAGVYVVITLIFSAFSYGPIQVRLSESLTLLPFYFGSWVAVALWLGCLIANAIGGYGIIDIVFGSLITLTAGLLTAKAPNIWVGALPPILLNAFGVAGILTYVLEVPYFPTALWVGLGQFIAVGIIGIPLMRWLAKRVKPYLT